MLDLPGPKTASHPAASTAAWMTLITFLLLAATPSQAESAPPKLTSNTFGGLAARAIGPAVMSGRISSIDAVAEDPLTIYVGSASGGLWKSTTAGTTFKPIFDQYPQSVGVVRVAPSDSQTVWVGTGEPWVRNSVSYGKGVYKSTDGGDSWKLMGLEDSERIGAIRIHPENADIVYACVLGHLFDDHQTRGVYKTKDGGETWDKVLYVDDQTGCADMDLDPQEPDFLYAAMWQFRRGADFFTSGGPGSGLYRSTDGGETWQEVRDGLPAGDLGRIAVAVAPSRPNVVYATVEAEDESGLYRSDDLGRGWTKLNSSSNVIMRPFYFSELVVDPVDHNRVYKPGFGLTLSVDGGESFSNLFGANFAAVHPDHHALWINPNNPQELILGTDGGVYISYDASNSWNHMKTLPVSQPYHVNVDQETPYNVYCGLQDNGSWTAPSRGAGGIPQGDWQPLSFGDGFWVIPDPRDSNIVYSEIQGGRLLRADKKLGITKSIFPYQGEGEEKLRFNWNAPIYLSPNDPSVLYFGSQYLHRSKDRGETWETISPDLTTDDPERQRQAQSGGLTLDNSTAENNTTIFTISESHLDDQVLWVGTDDGNLQLSRDGGQNWANVIANVPDLPAGIWVSEVAAGRHREATAFATFDGHYAGNFTPYVYRTDDFGATWTRLGADSLEGYAHVIKQDPENEQLLFVGTEMGLWISLDGGGQWARFKENLPMVPVHDLTIQEEYHDLVIATHGRGIYILDDLTPLRALTPDLMAQEVALLPSRAAEMVVGGAPVSPFAVGAADEFLGANPPEAADIVYHLSKRHLFGDLKVEIFNGDGLLLASLPGGKRKGLNRVQWPMRYKAPKMPRATSLVPVIGGPRVLEGTYSVRLTKGKNVLEGEVQLVPDRRTPFSKEDRHLQQNTVLDLYHGLEELTYLTQTLGTIHQEALARASEARTSEANKLKTLAQQAESERAGLVSTAASGIMSGDEKLREDLGNLYAAVSGYDGRPSQSQLTQSTRLLNRLQDAQARVAELISGPLAEANRRLEKRGAEPIHLTDRDSWMAEHSGTGAGGGAWLSSKAVRHVFATAFTGLNLTF